MADYTLQPTSILGGYDLDFDGASLTEVTGLAVISVALPLGGKDRLSRAVRSAYGCAMPKPNMSVLSKDKSVRLVSTQADQFFVLFDHQGPDAAELVAQQLGDAGYFTDQSDNFVTLYLSGAAARPALQRCCPLDLHPDVFALNASARSVMDHLGLLVVRTGDDGFMLMSARSSALSFLASLETAVENVT